MSEYVMNRLLSMCLTGLAATLAAQSVPASPDVTAQLEEIIHTDQIQAASKKMQDTAHAPADAVILRSSELRAMGYQTLGDALGGVVGFRTNEDHAYQGLAVRGLYVLGDQNTRILVLLDGHALNSPAELGSSKVGNDFGLPMELIDRIEIVRGPASSLYGNNAFEALINVVSVDAAESRPTSFVGAAAAGSNGKAELWVDGGGKVGGVAISMAATGFQRNGSTQLYPQLRDASLPAEADREERQSAYLRLKGSQWTFAGFYLNRTQRLASAPYGYLPGDDGNSYTNRRISGEFKWEPVTEHIKWMVRLFGDRNEFRDALIGDVDRGTEGDARDEDPDRSLGMEIQGRLPVSERLSVTFGTEQRLHRFSGFSESENGGTQVRSDVSSRIGNTYVEANWQATDRWTWVAGLQAAEWRPSRIHTTVDGVGSDLEQHSIQRLTPRLSAIYATEAGDIVKLIYGQGFRFPTIFERYYTDGGMTQSPNPSLAPEVMDSEQLAWSHKWTSNLKTQLSASLFQWQKQIVADTVQDVVMYQNGAGKIKGTSLEGELNWHSGNTEISGGAGWYEWKQDDIKLDNVSTWNGTLKCIQRMDAWSFSGEARYVGGRENLTAGTRVPANWTLRGSVRYETLRGWAQLTFEDLTNSRRRDLVSSEYDPITWMQADVRSVHAVVGLKF